MKKKLQNKNKVEMFPLPLFFGLVAVEVTPVTNKIDLFKPRYINSPTYTMSEIKTMAWDSCYSTDSLLAGGSIKNGVITKLENQIKNFNKITDNTPSQKSIELSLQIIDTIKDNGLNIDRVAPSADGGITFEFFTRFAYHAIEVYNDGDIVYLVRQFGVDEKNVVKDVNLNQTKDLLHGLVKHSV